MLKATKAQIDAAFELGLGGDELARMSRAEAANWIIAKTREGRRDVDEKRWIQRIFEVKDGDCTENRAGHYPG